MEKTNERTIIELFSQGQISRAEASRRIGEDISFSDMVRKLWKYQLHLPRYKSDPDSVGIRLIRNLVDGSPHV